MYLQTMNCYWQLTYRQCMRINYTISRPCSHVKNIQNNNVSSEIVKSQKFPDHQILYIFPYINHCRLLNRAKWVQTILSGVTIPLTIGAQVMGGISEMQSIEWIFTSCTLTALLYAITFKCNNLIGCIYFKEDKQEVIISYIDFWGKRIDLKTDIENITLLSVTLLNRNFYRILNIKPHNQKLKLFVKYGRILDETKFLNIVGDME